MWRFIIKINNTLNGDLLRAISLIAFAVYGFIAEQQVVVLISGVLLSLLLVCYMTTIRQLNMPGLHFNFFTWNLIARPIISLTAGIGFALVLWSLFSGLVAISPLTYNPMNLYVLVPTAVLITIVVALPDTESHDEASSRILTVPEVKKVAVMLFFGFALNVYFWSSDYSWFRKIGLRPATAKRIPPFTDEQGFLEYEPQFRLWGNSQAPEGDAARRVITAPSKNRAENRYEVTFVLEMINGRRTLTSLDAALELGDKGREELRELTGNFNDTDIPDLQPNLRDIFVGKPVLACFTKKSVKGHKIHSIIRSETGEMLYEIAESDSDEHLSDATRRLLRRLSGEANVDMLKEAAMERLEGGETQLNVTVIQTRDTIQSVLNRIGYKLIKVIFADIEFSEKVKAAAEIASAEQDERAGQLQSAETIKAVRASLMPTPEELDNPAFELNTIIAAAKDDKGGNIRVVWTPSSANPITGGIVGGAAAA